MLTKQEFIKVINEFLSEVDEMLSSTSTITHLHYCDAGVGKDGLYCIDSYSPFIEGEESDVDAGTIIIADGQIPYKFVHHGNLQCLGLCQLVYQLAEQGQIELQ